MAKSGDFEVADSSCRFHGIGHFLGELAIFWRIGHFWVHYVPYERYYNPRFAYFLPTFWESAISEYIMYVKD